MRIYTEKNITCPNCDHTIGVTLDASSESQEFYDDCPFCHRSIHLNMHIDHSQQQVSLIASIEDEPFS
ncbi:MULTISPECIES: CPXCG motif-containing cysteine-rich protein [Vibrio]|uniref:Molybdopterin-guanine dinucleotide biosynthesis protein A n=1 Tax=Vibrio genomosp. F10 str. ZF-129 TaxID=1187848 RepID=A0A1E5BGH2_9VIBR|nr:MULTISPECIES: CPXCG motif-containing cysteine-rich protein [Vibrio]OEE34555.1 molybdopterin-guanine dinucleotide biosynthesis protein A [Vibrio genomosp. F10 str. ZF-129]OEE93414.1 molybdopterin-guanine dinucleotide biosynthesis protein A [Vibrio genomosp. F10 str. 9ZC157]OEE94549.1 molybdopterin-guanine dinucleotide biosynthesis protein A [Vibrio genomosp. F10 str. 9ZD137]OEF05634.1 molybdopterin-guanine dinucleotide biosynthesis protein A [Vibrio genomosp. F10 str. 9ZB36]WGV99052.1 CPXCG 